MGKQENVVESYLVKRLRDFGGLCFKFVSPGHAGVPDRLCVWSGVTFFVECKTESGRLSALQQHTINTMLHVGALVYVAHSKVEIDEILDTILNIIKREHEYDD
jgi:hypothetical protein